MMLKTASGINSSGKPILDIGKTFSSGGSRDDVDRRRSRTGRQRYP
jgi:hypothetical protein